MMKRLSSIGRSGRLVLCALAGWLTAHGTVLAQPQNQQPAEGGSYVMPYFLVILAIALGLLFVCRSSYRRDRAKPEVYDEIKVKAKE